MRCHAAKVVDDAITVVAVAGAAAVGDPIRPGTRVPFVPPFGAIHVAWSSPHDVEQWIRRAPSPVFTAATKLGDLGDIEAVEPLMKVIKEFKDPYGRTSSIHHCRVWARMSLSGTPTSLASAARKAPSMSRKPSR